MTSFFPSRSSASTTLPSYGTESALPSTATVGDVATVLDTASIWVYGGVTWAMVASRINFAGVGTGVLNGGTITVNPGGASYAVSNGWGIYLDYTTSPHSFFISRWSNLTTVPVNNTRPNTYIAINKDGTLFETGTALTSSEERDYIYLGAYTQVGGVIIGMKSAPVLAISPANQFNDILRAIGIFKVNGLTFAGIPASLSLSRSLGVMFDRGNNWKNTEKDPHQIAIAAQSPLTFKRVTQTTINATNFTTLDVTNYDAAGTVTAISGSSNQAQNFRVYQWGTGTVYVQYGQVVYPSLSQAVSALPTESFVTNAVITPQDAVLVCSISVTKGATSLTNSSDAIFHLAGRFGDVGGGASGSVASVTLQQAFDNSLQPEIQTSSVNGGLNIRRGATASAGDIVIIENLGGTKVASVTDTGGLTIGTSTGILHSNASGVISSSPIVDADVDASAAIAGTKIAPNFGSQTVSTTGALSAFSVTGTSQVVSGGLTTSAFGYSCPANFGLDTSAAGTLSIAGSTATTLNLGVSTSNTTLNLSTGSGIATINVGSGLSDTLNLNAAANFTDPLLTLNRGGAAASGAGVGFEVEENGSSAGYIKVGATRTSYQLKPPAAGIIELVSAGADTTLTATSTVARALSLPNVSGTLVSSGDTGTVTATMLAADSVTSAKILDGTIVNADINASAAIDGTKIVSASASVAGVVTLGAQTLAGDKTLSGVTTISNATAASATDPTIGALVVTGGIGVGDSLTVKGGWIELGQGRAADGTSFVDFKSVSAAQDFSARVIRASGANGNLSITNTGTGTTVINNNGGGGVGNGTLVQGLRTSAVITTTLGATYGAATGYIGEILYSSLATTTATSASPQSAQIGTLTLTAGIWLVTTHVNGDSTGGTIDRLEVSIALAASTFDYNAASQARQGTGVACVGASRVMAVTANTIVYGFAIVTPASASSCRINGDSSAPERSYLRAVRIA